MDAAASLASVKLLGRSVPVAVRINVNNECHSKCRYCSFWHTPTEELSAQEWSVILLDLAALGTRRLSVSGGEPMLREDLGDILATAQDAGISVGLNTTGHSLPAHREWLQYIDFLKFSLDGRPEVHDRIRGYPGAFEELLAALDVARQEETAASLVVTMTSESIPEIPWLLDFAAEQGVLITFQPVMDHGHAHRTTRSTFPSREQYDGALARLREARRQRPGLVRNSLGALGALEAWPDFGDIRCFAGRAFVMIEANGDVVPCDRISYEEAIPNVREAGIGAALERLPRVDCGGCGFLGSLEINRMMDWRPGAVRGALSVLREN
jgi:MoaA/NifB/PqqE/SkfB family radical SAM enzyme